MASIRERARGALLGLAVGDALGAPAENLKPSEIRARWGRITGYVTDRPAGTDDTEYTVFSGLLLARHGAALTPALVEAAWHEWIADLPEGPFRGAGFSERGTLENLRRGLAAPPSPPSIGTPGATASPCGPHPSASSPRAGPRRRPGSSRSTAPSATTARASTAGRPSPPASPPRWRAPRRPP
ncbi:hypothetical protein GCM10020256_58490 [Streptomyces thermocoprophilus]